MARWARILIILVLVTVGLPAAPWQTAHAAPARRMIAYVRQKKEIRVIMPDGTGDRRIWAYPEPDQAEALGIAALGLAPGRRRAGLYQRPRGRGVSL